VKGLPNSKKGYLPPQFPKQSLCSMPEPLKRILGKDSKCDNGMLSGLGPCGSNLTSPPPRYHGANTISKCDPSPFPGINEELDHLLGTGQRDLTPMMVPTLHAHTDCAMAFPSNHPHALNASPIQVSSPKVYPGRKRSCTKMKVGQICSLKPLLIRPGCQPDPGLTFSTCRPTLFPKVRFAS